MTSVSVLIPYRPDGGERDRIWDWLGRRWEVLLPDYELVVSDDLGRGERLNRGQARNLAAERATGDVFVVGDADTAFNPAELEAAVAQVRSQGGWSVPRTYRQLTREATEATLAGSPSSALSSALEAEWVGEGSSVAPLLVVPAQAFREAGGYDERYPAWGSDDRSFHIALDALYRPYRRWPGTVFHLWHPRVERADSGAALTLAYLDALGDADAIRRLREGHLVR